MALTSTLHNLRIALNDSDRGVYETLDLRIARHPSETATYLLTRTLAYCLAWEPEIAFSKGLSDADEPPVWVRTLDGRVELWIEVGHPSGERLHKASKHAGRVAVYTSKDPQTLQQALAGERIHRGDSIELVGLPLSLLQALEPKLERRMDWDVSITGGQLYVTTGGETLEGEIVRTVVQP